MVILGNFELINFFIERYVKLGRYYLKSKWKPLKLVLPFFDVMAQK